MKKFLLTLSLLLSFGLSFSAVAQVDGVEAPNLEEPSFSEVEGLESIYDRTFSVDIETMLASPDADFAEMDMSAMMRTISIQGMQFDSEDNAEAYLDDMLEQMNTAMEENPEATEDVEVADLEGFDVDGVQITMDMPDLGIAATMNIFVDGNQVFQVMVMDSDQATASTLAEEVTQFVVDADSNDDDVTFNADGTSTGGVFERMPTADDEIVGDLTGVMDTEIFAGEVE